jgi:hypothetical protein
LTACSEDTEALVESEVVIAPSVSALLTRIGFAAVTPGILWIAAASLAGNGAATVKGPRLPVGTNQNRALIAPTVFLTSTLKLLATPLIIKARPNTRPVAKTAKRKRRDRHWRSLMLASHTGPMARVEG